MPDALPQSTLDQAFLEARTFNRFTDRPVSSETIRALYDLCKWGPTSLNCQPMRLTLVRSASAKEKLRPALSPNNVEKTMAAPLTAIVAYDTRFHEHLQTQFPAMPGIGQMFATNAAFAHDTAFRNSALQGGYLIVAARMLGLDAGPMSGFDAEKLNAAFFADGRLKANFLVNLGYGDAAGNRPRGPRLPFEDVVDVQ